MTNLFSIFDPSSCILNLSINWISTMMSLLLIPLMLWFMPSRNNMMWIILNNKLHHEFKTLLGKKKINKGGTFVFTSIFFFILINNFMGLFPYIFTSTSHMIFTLTMALPLWLSFILFGWIKNSFHMFTHLVPQGTPKVLMPFMVCIESIKNLIRPGTLSIRLTANMIAGHLLITLLKSSNEFFFMLPILISIQIMLLTLESAVAIIQAYVFAILGTLYSSEIN
uniref:ATP synthase subunit a n=1 Tax=Haania sp. JZ-2017 TaxID=2073092 RepID=A0A343UN26_9NEOP|nr:ATP synthase F0 subunit 6 [Haania sp. JZ-2017]